jgi:hypothetical protein
MHSSGGLDDLVNHSCNPNTGLYPLGGNLYLLSLRTIPVGEELSFDYSTSMVDEPWEMQCACDDDLCRGRVANFIEMPNFRQKYYASLRVLPEHVRIAFETRGAGTDPVGSASPSTASTASAEDVPQSVTDFHADTFRGLCAPKPVSCVVEDWKLYELPVPVKGRAVFAGAAIPPNKLVLKFQGPIYTKETCPDFSEAIQVGVDSWMWSSGGLDDLVNHSCDPNLGLFPLAGDLYLLSLRDIAEGEELSFDYSTSMVDEPWSMECACGEAGCRGKIANFIEMPENVQRRYAESGVLPDHVAIAYATRGAGKNDEIPTKALPSLAALKLEEGTEVPVSRVGI